MQVMSGLYTQNLNFSPARAVSPIVRTNSDVESQYLTELLAERQKLVPFMQVLPICSRLLNQEILRVSGMISDQSISDYDRLLRGSPSHVASLDIIQNVGANGLGVFPNSPQPNEWLGGPDEMTIDWPAAGGNPSSYVVKRVIRMDIPVDRYPNFNFVGRLLGPRGNSLKRVEASTGCRVFIRGKGSIKDPDKEESLRGRQGYEHLNDPLHVLLEAELPVNIIDVRMKQAREIIEELLKPVDESQDLYKRQQLRELAMLNNSFKEESPQPRVHPGCGRYRKGYHLVCLAPKIWPRNPSVNSVVEDSFDSSFIYMCPEKIFSSCFLDCILMPFCCCYCSIVLNLFVINSCTCGNFFFGVYVNLV